MDRPELRGACILGITIQRQHVLFQPLFSQVCCPVHVEHQGRERPPRKLEKDPVPDERSRTKKLQSDID